MAVTPTTGMPHSVSSHMHASYSPYFSPASTTTSDSSCSWLSMSPPQDSDVARQAKSKSPTNGKPAHNNGGFTFVTANKLDDFKSKENMTTVRKQAMGNYLSENGRGRRSRNSVARPRLQSEDSAMSQLSFGSQDGIAQYPSVEETINSSRGESSRARKQSSTAKSSRATSRDQRTPGPGTQLVMHKQSAVSGLLVHPLFDLPRNMDLPYDLKMPGPFVSLGKALDPFQAMHQPSDSIVSVEQLKHYCSRVFGTKAMGLHWIPLIIDKPHTFLSTLCIASAHHDAFNAKQFESAPTLALRQEIITLIGKNLCHTEANVDDHNIISLIQLITSEVIAREEAAVTIHERGLAAMIEKRGGLNQLPMRLASTVSWVALAASILQETTPRTMYIDFCASHSYPEVVPMTIPESPIYCPPRRDFETIKLSKQCDNIAKDLIQDIRDMINLFLRERKQERKHGQPSSQKLEALCNKVTNERKYPPTTRRQENTVLTPRDWKYEAIRITAVIQATAILNRIPLSEAIKQAASNSQNPSSLYTLSSGSRSDDALVSPMTSMRRDSLSSISPSFIPSPTYTPYPSFFPNAQRASIVSVSSSLSSDVRSRPSLVSSNSSFSDTYFPTILPPQNPFSRTTSSYNPPPITPTTLLTSLKDAINKSNLSDCWSDMAGVLLWIGLTVGAASRKEDRVLRKWFSALAIRASIMLCFEHPEAIHATMLKMGQVIEGLSGEPKPEVVAKEEKKRKV